jgi:hypothetical protein
MKKVAAIVGILFLVVTATILAGSCAQSSSDSDDGDGDYLELPPRASSSPAPFCGVVLWQANSEIEAFKASVSLEFSYFYYSDVASDDPAGGYQYNWAVVDAFLASAASRGHHGIVRFRDTDPELGTVERSLPDSLWTGTREADYDEGIDGEPVKRVVFPDWSNPALPAFIVSFYEALAARYPDQSTGLGYIEVGFGLWGEYHIDWDNLGNFSSTDCDTPEEALGRLFPAKADQRTMLTGIGDALTTIPWGISIDAADTDFGPYDADELPAGSPAFGLFDDSLLHEEWEETNYGNWEYFYSAYPARMNGGEFSYYTDYDQEHALDANGPNGVSLAEAARDCCISFVIGDGQSEYVTADALAAAGRQLGYALAIEDATILEGTVTITVRNSGCAVIPYHLYAAFGTVQSTQSLKGLLPDDSRDLTLTITDPDPDTFHFTSPVLLSGQVVAYTVE